MSIMAIIPAFNEEISIGSIVLKTRTHIKDVVVVDDGSKDETAKVAEMAGAYVIRHDKNMGKGEALKTGFNYAMKNGTTIIVTIDADGQHDPNDIPKVIKPILKKDADLVIGSRYLNGNCIPRYRRAGQFLLDRMTKLNTGIEVTDTQSGFRAFSIDCVSNFKFRNHGFAIESEMLADVVSAKLKIKEVDIGVRYDVDCNTENPIYHGLKVFLKILYDIEFKKPLYYFTIPGIILGISGLIMGLEFLQIFYRGGSLQFGPTLLMILLTLIGIFMTFTGVILDSISKLMKNNK